MGGSYQSLPVDQSQKRLCEERCFGLLDDMNNWNGPKYMIAEGDTYMKYPDDETYPELMVNYVKLDRVPKFTESWDPLLKAVRSGELLCFKRRDIVPGLEGRRGRWKTHLYGRPGMDISFGVRRARLGRRQENGPPAHSRHKIRPVRK